MVDCELNILTASSTSKISEIPKSAPVENAGSEASPNQASPQESAFSSDQDSFDVYTQLVKARGDFVGMLAYSLYKRHKIEWLQAHPQDDHQAFKKVACTPQQVEMYRSQAEQMMKTFMEFTLDDLGEEMRTTILSGEVLSSVREMEPSLGRRIDALKQKWYGILFNHFLGGVFSSLVAVGIFTFVSAYNKYQEVGGIEGEIKKGQAKHQIQYPAEVRSTTHSSAPPAKTDAQQ